MPADATPGLAGDATELDQLRAALAVARADLRLHVAALSRLQGELMASRLEVAGARGETTQFRGFLTQAQADVESAHAHIGELRMQAATREAEFQAAAAALQAAAAGLQAEIAALHASFSWRLTRPVRRASTTLRRLRGRLGRHGGVLPAQPDSSDAAAPSPALPDPNAPYLLRPSSAPATGQGMVTVEELRHLSRSP